MKIFVTVTASIVALAATGGSASTYLNNDAGVTAALGASMGTDVFVNVSDAQSLANMIDLDSAAENDVHSQTSHIWYIGSDPLEVDFDLGAEYDLSTLHFWNYFTESVDVDQIDFMLTDTQGGLVGSTSVAPLTGESPGSEIIEPADYAFSFNSVRYINAKFSGTNNNVDFNNIGWSAANGSGGTPPGSPAPMPEPPSVIPLPPSGLALLAGAGLLVGSRFRRR